MIAGIGVDIVDVPRFIRTLERTPRLVSRLFVPGERVLTMRSLAARFAAKEALMKALGDSTGFRWHDMEVVTDREGRPSFRVSGQVAAAIKLQGISALHLSLSHDGDSACAFVIAERVNECDNSPVATGDDES